MFLKKFDAEIKVGSYVSGVLRIPAASCLQSPDFLYEDPTKSLFVYTKLSH